jgi:hypothetical protein
MTRARFEWAKGGLLSKTGPEWAPVYEVYHHLLAWGAPSPERAQLWITGSWEAKKLRLRSKRCPADAPVEYLAEHLPCPREDQFPDIEPLAARDFPADGLIWDLDMGLAFTREEPRIELFGIEAHRGDALSIWSEPISRRRPGPAPVHDWAALDARAIRMMTIQDLEKKMPGFDPKIAPMARSLAVWADENLERVPDDDSIRKRLGEQVLPLYQRVR